MFGVSIQNRDTFLRQPLVLARRQGNGNRWATPRVPNERDNHQSEDAETFCSTGLSAKNPNNYPKFHTSLRKGLAKFVSVRINFLIFSPHKKGFVQAFEGIRWWYVHGEKSF